MTPERRPLRPPGTVLNVLLFAALAWVLFWYVTQALTRYPDFDGALNLNVSRALLEGHGYGSFYERFRLFPIETQTNAPLVFPAAVALAVFDFTPFGGQAANLAYLLAFCLLAGALVRRACASAAAAALAVLLALQVPGMRDFALNGYGEIPALCWMLFGMLALWRRIDGGSPYWTGLGGVALALSVLTKTVSLIWFPSTIGVFLALRWQRDGFRAALRDALLGAIGIVAVLTAWEVFRLWSLGGWDAWIDWWDTQFLEVQKQAGVEEGYADTAAVDAKLFVHLRGLFGMLGLPRPIASLWLLLPFIAGGVLLWRERDAGLRYVLGVLLGVAATYLVWWLTITPTEMMWLRRILLGLLLLQLAAVVLAWRLLVRDAILARIAGAVLMVSALWLGLAHHLLWERPDTRAEAQQDRAFFAAVSELPADAMLFGSGWWQAPIAALYSGRPMHDEEAWDLERFRSLERPAYLVLDRYAVHLGDHLRWRLGWRCRCVPVYVGGGGRIYRMRELFSAPESSGVRALRLAADEVAGDAGLAAPGGSVRWVERRVSIDLPTLAFDALVLDFSVPDLAGFAPHEEPLELRVTRGACELLRRPLEAGAQSLLIDDSCPDADGPLRIEVNGQLDPARIAPDTRALAWILRGIEIHPR